MHDNAYLKPQEEHGSAITAELKARLEHAGVLRRNPSRLEAVPKFLSVRQTAEVFGVSHGTVNNLVNENRLPAVQVGGKGSRVQIPLRAINLIIDLAMITGGMVTLENWREVLDDLVASELIDARDMADLMADPTANRVNAGPVRQVGQTELEAVA